MADIVDKAENAELLATLLKRPLETLGWSVHAAIGRLVVIGLDLNERRWRDIEAPTDVELTRVLQQLRARPDGLLALSMADVHLLPDFAADALCGMAGGHDRWMRGGAFGDTPTHLSSAASEHMSLMTKAGLSSPLPGEGGLRGLVLTGRTPSLASFLADAGLPSTGVETLLSDVVTRIGAHDARPAWRQYALEFGIMLIEQTNSEHRHSVSERQALNRGYRESDLAAWLRGTIARFDDAFREEFGTADTAALRWLAHFCMERLLGDPDRALRRQALQALASSFPAEVREEVTNLIERLKRQYETETGRGKKRDTRGWITAHAKWHLIRDVLDALWPAERGPLDKHTQPAVVAVCVALLGYAPTLPLHAGRRLPRHQDETDINIEHVSEVASLRLNMHSLNAMLDVLNLDILNCEVARQAGIDGNQLRERKLRRRCGYLLRWRRELERRLEQGDYARGAKAARAKRSTGPRLEVPRLGSEIRALPMKQRIVRACVEAILLERKQRLGPPGE